MDEKEMLSLILEKMDGLEKEVSSIKEEQKKTNNRLGNVENRLGNVENRLDTVENYLKNMKYKLDLTYDQVGGLTEFKTSVESRLAEHDEEIKILKKAVANS